MGRFAAAVTSAAVVVVATADSVAVVGTSAVVVVTTVDSVAVAVGLVALFAAECSLKAAAPDLDILVFGG